MLCSRRSALAKSTPLFVGLDVHTPSRSHAAGGCSDPPVFVGTMGTRQADLDRLIRRLQGTTADLRFVCEAGPSGYGLYRYLTGKACPVMSSPPRSFRGAPGGQGQGRPA
jgi:hypothetical protein